MRTIALISVLMLGLSASVASAQAGKGEDSTAVLGAAVEHVRDAMVRTHGGPIAIDTSSTQMLRSSRPAVGNRREVARQLNAPAADAKALYRCEGAATNGSENCRLDGVVGVISAQGIEIDGDQATVELEVAETTRLKSGESRVGFHGTVVRLERRQGKWVVVDVRNTWAT